jgi:hypothetical protein
MQTAAAQETMQPSEHQKVVEGLASSLKDNYVFPEVAQKMSTFLKKRLKEGAYNELSNPVTFATQLTKDIQAISNDLHLRVNFNPEAAMHMNREEDEEGPSGPSPEYLKQAARSNHGFKEVKIMDGNVGYLDLRGFHNPALAGETAAAAMNMLSNAEVIIFDLRQNGGGDPAMIQLLTSYLYPVHQSVHLNTFYFRPTDEHSQTWTLPYVPGKRNPEAEVFVLTSPYTFSAAEEFTYNLKNLERATIVGETTGGGAHPGGNRPISERFVAFVPTGRAINPITNTNWEGTGVSPHVEVDHEKALDKAYQLAMEKQLEKAETQGDKAFYGWYASLLRAKNEPVNVEEDLLKAYAGNYGERNLYYKDGILTYQRNGRPEMELIAIDDKTFNLASSPDFRIELDYKDGKAAGLIMRSVNGYEEYNERKSEAGTRP